MSVADSGPEIVKFLDQIFAAGKGSKPLAADLEADLVLLFESSTKGFREIVLTMLVAKAIDPDFDPSVKFYDCNPRPLYEDWIRVRLTEIGAPRGKSGPLNVAKNQNEINESWATRKRPEWAAMAAVRYASRISSASPEEILLWGCRVAHYFRRTAEETADLYVEVDPNEDLGFLVSLVIQMIFEAPAGGATAQRIAGLALETQAGEGSIEGHADSVSATNTTSKKAGDLIINRSRVAEVTTKTFDDNRMEDSYESVRAIDEVDGTWTTSVIVLCTADDVPEAAAVDCGFERRANAHLGTFEFRDLRFDFVDVYEWLASQIATMTPEQRREFHSKIGDYVADPNTHPRVKKVWAEVHA